ncbi:MurR/RpiR family transcriptional regulator [Lactococcus garvieae]|uniref:Sialic acid utilization regulator, RpiR family n=1 Tax=Lactococcus garvieae DCC43 TaxID=1231377 RepID=K2PL34_9LACT|nr:MurR/RpiR family transcriptional regulator [Lactococcus garvieae]EKF52040.1 Sialic acid utilization regulator, RpiR family [Lactococcus garvieae DCC43]QPS70613.1 MurR/RpiR family transcriptional regulator [Lactococcus garvieae]
MSFKERVSIHYTELTKTDRKITGELMRKPEVLINRAIQEAAKDLEVSPSAIMRVVKKLRYRGLPDLKNSLENYKNEKTELVESTKEKILSESIIDDYKERLNLISTCLSEKQLANIAQLIQGAKTTRVLGIGSSGLAAEQFVYSLLYQDKYVEAITSRTKIFYLSRVLDEDTLLIIFTVSGNAELYEEIFEQAKETGAKIVLITMNRNSKFKKLATEVVLLPSNVTDFSKTDIYQLDNRFAFIVLSEILAAYYLNF